MKSFKIILSLLLASSASALPLSKRIYIPEETRIATAYPESEAQIAKEDAKLMKRIYIPEETRIATAYPESEAQIAKEDAKLMKRIYIPEAEA